MKKRGLKDARDVVCLLALALAIGLLAGRFLWWWLAPNICLLVGAIAESFLSDYRAQHAWRKASRLAFADRPPRVGNYVIAGIIMTLALVAFWIWWPR